MSEKTPAKKHPIYHVWHDMRARCHRKGHKDYARYGGRGISICPEWDNFWKFVEDMGPRPPGRSIDRIDNNGNYEPGNCRWATPSQQSRNSINSKLTEAQVTQMKQLLSLGVKQVRLAKLYKISIQGVSLISQGKSWKGVPSRGREA